MTRKSEVIRNLIELSTWRKQLRYARKAKRFDLALDAVDNGFACVAAAIQASIRPKAHRDVRRRKEAIPRSAAARTADGPGTTSPDARSSR